jgi:hypothetical protein
VGNNVFIPPRFRSEEGLTPNISNKKTTSELEVVFRN